MKPHTMTVRELIAALQTIPGKYKVTVGENDYLCTGSSTPRLLRFVRVYDDPMHIDKEEGDKPFVMLVPQPEESAPGCGDDYDYDRKGHLIRIKRGSPVDAPTREAS